MDSTSTSCRLAGGRVVILLTVSTLLAGCAAARQGEVADALPPVPPPTGAAAPLPAAALAVPSALVDPALNLRAGPVSVPLQLQAPSLGLDAQVVGVGITAKDVMDAPMGPTRDPVWQQAFWYRGSAVPGTASTAVIAGHVNGAGGRPAVFAQLSRLRPGDPVVVRDTRNGLDVRFSVTEAHTYPLEDTTDPAVLRRIYGAGPVAGTPPQPSADGLAHLTLITCTGTFRDGTHDHRLVVYATRTS